MEKESNMQRIVRKLVKMCVEDYVKTGCIISFHGVPVVPLINKNLKIKRVIT